ncbi:hypothetical protein RUND412_008028 [Rhizina undulata]
MDVPVATGLSIYSTSDDIHNLNLPKLLDLEYTENLILNDFEALNEHRIRQQWSTSELSTFRTQLKIKIDEAKWCVCRE